MPRGMASPGEESASPTHGQERHLTRCLWYTESSGLPTETDTGHDFQHPSRTRRSTGDPQAGPTLWTRSGPVYPGDHPGAHPARPVSRQRGNGELLEGATTLEDLIDHRFVADCTRDNELDIPTIEEVRQGLAKIPGCLAQDIIAEREDRVTPECYATSSTPSKWPENSSANTG